MPILAATANPFSRARYALATSFATHCPPELGAAIVVTGSVSRDYADEFSDLELRFLVDSLQPLAIYQDWLRSLGGVVEEEVDAAYEGGAQTKSWHGGIFVEAFWQPWPALDARLAEIVAAQTTEHWSLTEAWHIADALPVRDHSHLAQWQERLAVYPLALQARLIQQATQAWIDPHWWPVSFATIWPLAYRDARLALANRLSREIERGLRILFALNERWEPDYKWLAGESRRLSQAPADLVARVNAVFSQADPRQAVTGCLTLLDDILALVPPSYALGLPRQQLREVLDAEHLPGSR